MTQWRLKRYLGSSTMFFNNSRKSLHTFSIKAFFLFSLPAHLWATQKFVYINVKVIFGTVVELSKGWSFSYVQTIICYQNSIINPNKTCRPQIQLCPIPCAISSYTLFFLSLTDFWCMYPTLSTVFLMWIKPTIFIAGFHFFDLADQKVFSWKKKKIFGT